MNDTGNETEHELQTKTVQIFETMLESCRLCLRKPGDISISILDEMDEESLKFSDIAMSMADIEITEDDGYPKILCIHCAEKLQNFHQFRKKCELSHITLKAVIPLGESIRKELAEQSKQHEYIENENENVNEIISINEGIDSIQEIPLHHQQEVTEYMTSVVDDEEIYLERASECLSTNSGSTGFELNANDSYSIIELRPFDTEPNEMELKPATESGLVQISRTIRLSDNEKLEEYTRTKRFNRKTEDGHVVKQFQCDECGKVYGRKSDLRQHANTHSGYKRFSCDLCQQLFTRKSHLAAHMLIHNQVKPYTCDVCGQSFRKLSNMSRHKVIHENVYNFSCEVCGKQFKRSAAVKCHMRTHSGIRPYQCKVCQTSYTSYSGYKSHLKKHSVEYKVEIDELEYVEAAEVL